MRVVVGERVHTDLNSLIMNEAVATGRQEGRKAGAARFMTSKEKEQEWRARNCCTVAA